MEDIIHKFGIDARLIIIQIINFTVLLGLLSYFLYKPLLKVLAEREDKIVKGVSDAEEAGKALASAEDEKKVIVTAAHKDAEEVSARAKTHAEEKTVEIMAAAENKASDVIKAAEKKCEDLKVQAHKESEAEIAKLAILAAEKVLQQKTS